MGRKVFGSEVLTSADVNSLLMDQAVMVFASASARSAAIPQPTLGMHTHLTNTGQTQRWNGLQWRDVAIAKVAVGDTVNGQVVGDYRDHPTYGFQRWDGSAWSRASRIPSFASLAARDAFYASPNTPKLGDQAFVTLPAFTNVAASSQGPTLMTYDGAAWRFIVIAGVSYTSDSNGNVTINHNIGQQPYAAAAAAGVSSTLAQTNVHKAVASSATTTSIGVYNTRTDTSAAFSNPGLAATLTLAF